jgi:hypothetical protein
MHDDAYPADSVPRQPGQVAGKKCLPKKEIHISFTRKAGIPDLRANGDGACENGGGTPGGAGICPARRKNGYRPGRVVGVAASPPRIEITSGKRELMKATMRPVRTHLRQ